MKKSLAPKITTSGPSETALGHLVQLLKAGDTEGALAVVESNSSALSAKPTSDTATALPPNTRPTEEQVADAMRELEVPIYDLKLMIRISSDFVERLLNRPDRESDDMLHFRISKEERETVLFALFNVESRISNLKKQFLAAWDGRQSV